MDSYNLSLPSLLLDSLPTDNVIIDCVNSEFYEAVRHLNKLDVIGLSFEEPEISRHSSLKWLCVSTALCTFLFDVQKLGKRAFTEGLRRVLENRRIVKVIHDCRRPSDCLYHQYGTKLVNVYDTQVAEFMATAQTGDSDNLTERVHSLNHCLSVYLKVPTEYLHQQRNAVYFNERPLSNELRDLFIKNVIYLRLLRNELNIILRIPYRRCVDVYLQSIQKMTDQDLKLQPPNLKSIPPELFLENMQVFKVSEQLVKAVNSSKVVNGRLDDPYDRYKRDCEKYQNVGISMNDKEIESNGIQNGFIDNDRSEIVQYLMDKMFNGDVQADCSKSYDNLSDLNNSQIFNRRNSFDGGSLMEQSSVSMYSSVSKDEYATEVRNVHVGEFSESKIPISSKNINEFSGKFNLLENMLTEKKFENLKKMDNSSSKDACTKSPLKNLSLSYKLKMLLQSANIANSDTKFSEENCSAQTSSLLTSKTVSCKKSNSQKQSTEDLSVSIKENVNLYRPKTDLHSALVEVNVPSLPSSDKNVPKMLLKSCKSQNGSISKHQSNSDDNSSNKNVNREALSSSSNTDLVCKDDLHVRPLSVGTHSQNNFSSMLSKYRMLLKKTQNGSISESRSDLDDISSTKDVNGETSLLSSNTNFDCNDEHNNKLSADISSQNAGNLSEFTGVPKVNVSITEQQNVSRFRNTATQNFGDWSSDEDGFTSSKSELSIDKSEDISNNASEDPWARLRGAFADRGPTRNMKLRFIPAGMQC